MLVLTRKENERIVIGGNIFVTVLEIRGDIVRLGVTAPRNVVIDREEIHHKRSQPKDTKGLAGANSEQEMYLSGDHKQIYQPGSKQGEE